MSRNKYTREDIIRLVKEENVRMARLKVVSITMKVLKDALELLGIECPEQM